VKHLSPMNKKARRLVELAESRGDGVSAMAIAGADGTPFSCTTIFDPGWEVDASGGTHGLCQPIERDLYDCYHSCYWPAQVPDSLTNWPKWASSCGSPMNDWTQIDLVFP
jgi:hypothetical protein